MTATEICAEFERKFPKRNIGTKGELRPDGKRYPFSQCGCTYPIIPSDSLCWKQIMRWLKTDEHDPNMDDPNVVEKYKYTPEMFLYAKRLKALWGGNE